MWLLRPTDRKRRLNLVVKYELVVGPTELLAVPPKLTGTDTLSVNL